MADHPLRTGSEELTAASTTTSETATTVLVASSDITTTVSFDATSATTVAVDTTLATSEAETSTAIDGTITADTTTIADTTTVADTTTATNPTAAADTTTVADTTTTAETTTTAGGSFPTFALRISGGPLDGSPAQQNGYPGASIVFNPTFSGAHASTYAIEPSNGRVRDTQTGVYLCAYYGWSPMSSDPPLVTNCYFPIYTGDDQQWNYLTCTVVFGLLSCTVPRGSCQEDDVCTTEAGVNDQFYYRHSSSNDGDLWYIGSATDNPTGYTAINMAATKS